MAATTEIIISMMERQWSQAQQSETQRATMTNFVLLIVGGIQGLIVQNNFERDSVMLAIIMLIVGLWGILAAEKYYERFRLAVGRVGRWMEKLEMLDPNAEIAATEARADQKHNKKFPLLVNVRLHVVWRILHIAIVIVAIANLVIVLSHPREPAHQKPGSSRSTPRQQLQNTTEAPRK